MTPTDTAVHWLSKLIATPSISRKERGATHVIQEWAAALGLSTELIGENVRIRVQRGEGPRLVLCTHYDTVPPAAGYTRDPFQAEVIGDRLYGLGSNDAGASIAAMLGAAAALSRTDGWKGTLEVAIVVQEEVNGADGAEMYLAKTGLPNAAVIGEPTGLDVCIAQKGLLVMDCTSRGLAVHAANAYRLEHKNAILEAMEDIRKIHGIEFPKRDKSLGPTTLNVTVIQGGAAHNSIPDKCDWTIDARVNPAQSLEEIVETVRASVKATVAPRSVRLRAIATKPGERIVQLALAARPKSMTYGSDAMSDMVFFRGCPVIKCGPGITEMSHKPDEHVEVRWITEGMDFYARLAAQFLTA